MVFSRPRVVIGALCSAGIATMLQGCGGGATTTTTTTTIDPATAPATGCSATAANDKCMCPTFDMKTGQYSSTTDASMIGVFNGLEIPLQMDIKVDLKMDLEKFNLRMDATTPPSLLGPGIEIKQITNSAKNVSIEYRKQETEAAVCKKETPSTPEEAKKGLDKARLNADKAFKCKGNDGTFDSWEIDQDFWKEEGAEFPPNVTIITAIKSDNQHHLKSISIEGIASKPYTDFKTFSTKTEFTVVSDTGPSDADLDFSSWDCDAHLHDASQKGFVSLRSLSLRSLETILGAIYPTASAPDTKDLPIKPKDPEDKTEGTTFPSTEEAIGI